MKQRKNSRIYWEYIQLKYSSKLLAHIKKHLGHIGTLENVQNNCIKLSGFVVDVNKLFLHREMTRNISCRKKFFNPKILSQVFRTNLTYLFHYLCRLFRAKETW